MFSSSAQEIERARDLLGILPDEKSPGPTPDSSEEKSAFSLPRSIKKLLLSANMTTAEQKRFLLEALFGSFLALAIAGFTRSIFPLIVPLLLFYAQYLRVARRVHKRAESFEKDYTAFLLSLASAIKTGQDPLTAFMQTERLFHDASELRKQVLISKDLIERGSPEDEAVLAFACDIAHPDLPLFRTAFVLARKEGSSLSECLHRLARVTRQRQSFRRKIRGAIAMQKLSAYGICGCTVAIGLLQFVVNREGVMQAVNHPLGSKVLLAGAVCIAIGIIWMTRICKARI